MAWEAEVQCLSLITESTVMAKITHNQAGGQQRLGAQQGWGDTAGHPNTDSQEFIQAHHPKVGFCGPAQSYFQNVPAKSQN